MRESLRILTAGPPDAARSVLLLPGGAMAARSFKLVMAGPTVSPLRLVATTLPGMAGAPLSEDVSIPGLARRAGELAKQNGCDVVVGSTTHPESRRPLTGAICGGHLPVTLPGSLTARVGAYPSQAEM
jgi:hypothetical protein